MNELRILKALIFFLTLNLFYSGSAQDERKPNEKLEHIIFVYKTHFDIGYTDLAERIVQKYSTSMINETLETLKDSEGKPKDMQFAWTLPGWPMKQILDRRPGELKEIISKAIKDGRFVVHAFPFTFETEASDPESLVRGLRFSSDIARNHGLELPRDAKLTDVPSQSWFIPTLMKHAGIDFLHIGCNPASPSPDVPLLFWWEGPDGSRVMTMYWEPYYGTDIIPPEGYPFKTWIAIIHTNDNVGAPPYPEVAKNLETARKLAPNAKITIGRMSDFYDELMKENPELPVIKGDMPDTWVHGFMSMPKEVKINKKVKSDLIGMEILSTQLEMWGGPENDLADIISDSYEKSLLFDEHTFGLAMSHGSSGTWTYDTDFTNMQTDGSFHKIELSWLEKGLRVHDAELKTNASYSRKMDELAGMVDQGGSRIVVFNQLAYNRDGLVTIHQNSGWFSYKAVMDVETGEVIPMVNVNNVMRFQARNIPASGYKTYLPVEEIEVKSKLKLDEENHSFENEFIKIKIDPGSGSIKSMINKNTGKEVCNQADKNGLGSYLYERFSKKQTEEYANSYIKAGWNWALDELGRPNLDDSPYRKSTGKDPKIVFIKDDISISAYVSFTPDANNPHRYTVKYTLYEAYPYLELDWAIHSKPAEPWPEGGWISFPLNIADPEFKLARIGGVVDPTKDFIGKTNQDYTFTNSGLAVLDKNNSGVGIFSPNVPAVSLGRPGLWEYSRDYTPRVSNIYFNLFNNQWSTNFTEWIEGSWSAKFYFWIIDDFDNENSLINPVNQFKSPLMAKAAGGPGGDLPVSQSGISISRKGVQLTAFGDNPDGDGILLRIWEQAGKGGEIIITLPAGHGFTSAYMCNLRGEENGERIDISGNQITVMLGAHKPLSLILR